MRIQPALAALMAATLALGACGSSTEESAATQAAPAEAPDVDGGAADGTAEPPTTVVEKDFGPIAVYDSLLDRVKSRGHLSLRRVRRGRRFSETQPDGSQKGFDVDYCERWRSRSSAIPRRSSSCR